jgi:hypothetical protein
MRSPCVVFVVSLPVLLTACDTSTATVPVASLEVVPSTLTLIEGEERTLEAVARAADGSTLSGRSVSWTSDGPLVASVDDAGRVTAVGMGETAIRATVEGVNASAALTVQAAPRVALATDDVELEGVQGSASANVQVQVTNGGAGVLAGLATSVNYPPGAASGWLTVTLNGTTAPTSVTLRGDAAALVPGSYEATVVVSSSSGPGSSAALGVTFTVEPRPPLIVLEPDGVAFIAVENGNDPATQSVSILNGGAGVLLGLAFAITYGEGQPSGWLQADLTGTIAPTLLELSASPAGLAPGTYHATVEISSPVAVPGTAAVAVSLTVAAGSRVPGPERRP